MNSFEQEIREKRNLARSARNRVGGSKSRRCSLPSDRLTPSQWRAKNGPVLTLRLGQPMTWTDYEKLDDSLRRCYAADAMAGDGDRLSRLCALLNIDRQTCLREVRRLGFLLQEEDET